MIRKLLLVSNRRALLVRLFRANRWWVIANRTLFVRTGFDSAAGLKPKDWVFRRIFVRGTKSSPRIMALVVDLGRLGNALSRVSKAVTVAQENHWAGVVVPRHSHFPAYSALIARETVDIDGFLITCGDSRWGAQGSPDLIVRREFHNEPIEPGPETRTVAKQAVRELFSGLQPRGDLSDSTLAIHVRSGDIYFRERVGNWGQPPVAYYERIIREGRWERVLVVCEDKESPVLRPIEALCDDLGIKHIFQSTTLAEDLAVLVGAKNLVVGRGTFAPAVVLLNPVLERIFFFEDRFDSKFLDQSTKVIRVVDQAGDYRENVLQGKWVNSPAQRQLMVDYPASALTLETVSS